VASIDQFGRVTFFHLERAIGKYLLSGCVREGNRTRRPIDAQERCVLNCRDGAGAVRHLDVAVMFASLWLLASMVIDAVTPQELTVYMIGATIAPAIVILAVLYWKRVSRFDFAVALATLWMVTWIVLELISPKPLSLLLAAAAAVPLLAVGAVVNFRRWRDLRARSGSTRLSS
jgi:hypothetical protein